MWINDKKFCDEIYVLVVYVHCDYAQRGNGLLV